MGNVIMEYEKMNEMRTLGTIVNFTVKGVTFGVRCTRIEIQYKKKVDENSLDAKKRKFNRFHVFLTVMDEGGAHFKMTDMLMNDTDIDLHGNDIYRHEQIDEWLNGADEFVAELNGFIVFTYEKRHTSK